MPDIEPCPWCGEKARCRSRHDVIAGTRKCFVCCENDECGGGPHRDSEAEAVAAWNGVVRAQRALEEKEADMHTRIRGEYDETIADCWRAAVAGKDARIAELEGRVAQLEREAKAVVAWLQWCAVECETDDPILSEWHREVCENIVVRAWEGPLDRGDLDEWMMEE